MPGPNPSDNPDVDYTSLDAVLKLLENQAAFLAELRRADAVHLFLLRISEWKGNSEQRVANGMPLLPPPMPPPGYTPPDVPAAPPVPPPDFTPVVLEKVHFPPNPPQYPSPGDKNPAGTVITWNGILLIKVVRKTPFGDAHWWEDKK